MLIRSPLVIVVASIDSLIKDFRKKSKVCWDPSVARLKCVKLLFDFYLSINIRKMRLQNIEIPLITYGEEETTVLVIKKFNYPYSQSEPELYNKLLHFYNDEYWLISMWIWMNAHVSDSVLGREIVRAFIKNSINHTSIRLLKCSEIHKEQINTDILQPQLLFYKEVFSVKNIVKQMRKRYRDKLKLSMQQKKWHKHVDIQKKGLNSEEMLCHLFRQNELSHFAPLIKIANKYHDNLMEIDLFINSIIVIFSNTRNKKYFRHVLNDIHKSTEAL